MTQKPTSAIQGKKAQPPASPTNPKQTTKAKARTTADSSESFGPPKAKQDATQQEGTHARPPLFYFFVFSYVFLSFVSFLALSSSFSTMTQTSQSKIAKDLTGARAPAWRAGPLSDTKHWGGGVTTGRTTDDQITKPPFPYQKPKSPKKSGGQTGSLEELVARHELLDDGADPGNHGKAAVVELLAAHVQELVHVGARGETHRIELVVARNVGIAEARDIRPLGTRLVDRVPPLLGRCRFGKMGKGKEKMMVSVIGVGVEVRNQTFFREIGRCILPWRS